VVSPTVFVIGTAVFFVVLRLRGHHVTGSLVIGMWLTAMIGALAGFIA